ncbi:MAG: hypothetical protein AMXMBFR46_17360 [Acidimicrobiia bacterium]
MKRPAVASVVVFLVIVVVFGAIAAAELVVRDGAPAVEVGSSSVPAASVNDELRAVAENEDLADLVGAENVSIAPGSVVSGGASQIVTLIVLEELSRQYLDREGERITSADRATGAEMLEDTAFGQAWDGFPAWFRERYHDRFAVYAAFARALGGDFQSATTERVVRREARNTDIAVNPVYGRFAPAKLAVVPFPALSASDPG